MTERLESIEKSLKDGGKDKDKEKPKDEPKKEEPPVDGWEKIEKYFKGK